MLKKILLALLMFVSFAQASVEDDKKFLEMVAEKTFHFFWDEANPANGLIADATKNRNCSISVVGFGLSAICIAADRGWITRKQAYDRALITLQNFADYPGNPCKSIVEATWTPLSLGGYQYGQMDRIRRYLYVGHSRFHGRCSHCGTVFRRNRS